VCVCVCVCIYVLVSTYYISLYSRLWYWSDYSRFVSFHVLFYALLINVNGGNGWFPLRLLSKSMWRGKYRSRMEDIRLFISLNSTSGKRTNGPLMSSYSDGISFINIYILYASRRWWAGGFEGWIIRNGGLHAHQRKHTSALLLRRLNELLLVIGQWSDDARVWMIWLHNGFVNTRF